MNKATFVLALLALPAAAHAESLRQDCADQVKAAVVILQGDNGLADDNTTMTVSEDARKAVVISNVKTIASTPNAGGPDGSTSDTSSANISSGDLKGTVVVTATRGGCFVKKMIVKD